MSKLNANQVVEIKKMYNRGFTSSEIASKYNVTDSNIRMIVTEKSWKNIGPKIKKTQSKNENYNKILHLLKNDPYMTYANLAESIGISVRCVVSIVSRCDDLKSLKKDGRLPVKNLYSKIGILSLYSKGYTQQRIADILGVSQPSVSSILRNLSKEFNFPLRKRYKLQNYDIKYIKMLHSRGSSLDYLASKYKISKECLKSFLF